MLDDGAIGRGDPSVRHHFRDSVSDTMRITDLAAPRKIPPGTGWRKFVYSVSFHKINPGESPRERHYRNLQGRIRRHIRRQYVITVVSGKGGVGVTTMAACIGGVFRECRPENVIAIDAVPSFGTLADRIDESPPGDYAAIINDTDVQGYADIREHLGQNTVGLDVLAGNRTSDQPRPLVPAMFSAVLSRLRRTHTVIVIDTSPDLEQGMVELFDADLKRKGFDGVALPAGSYELHKINGVRLDINKSLDELGVQDGDTLVLVPRVAGESFEPQYESLSTGLAAMGKWLGRDGGDRMFAPVTSLTAAHTAMAIIAMAVGVVLALTLRTRTITDSPVPAAMAGGIGVLLVIGALVVWWGWRERRDLFSGFGWLAVVLLAVAAACAPPGALGAAHALIGLVVVVLGAITIGVATRKRWQTAVVTAVVTVCGILAAVAAVRMFRPVSMQVLAICVLVGLLVLIRMTPTVALWVARVRPPHFGSITGRDLFARRAGMPVDTVAPVSEADADDEDNELTDITARGTAIAASARLVNAVQVGMCVGVSLVLPAAVWGVLTPRQPWAWLALLVAGLTVGLFITQGRGFAAKYQAVALVCGASAAVCAGVLKYALDTPKGVQTGLLWPAIFVAAFAALGLAVALVVPATRFRPIIRLTVEWLEVLAMIALLPAAAALGGLFAWLRH